MPGEYEAMYWRARNGLIPCSTNPFDIDVLLTRCFGIPTTTTTTTTTTGPRDDRDLKRLQMSTSRVSIRTGRDYLILRMLSRLGNVESPIILAENRIQAHVSKWTRPNAVL